MTLASTSSKTISRRRFLLSAVALAAAGGFSADNGNAAENDMRPLLGAIRWDAWYSPGSVPTAAVETSLAPPQYRWRLPFFAQQDERDSSKVELPALTQSLMDLEIRQAAYAGLDFWAFVAYGHDNSLSLGLSRYLSSSLRSIRFCMFTQLEYWGSRGRPAALIDEHLTFMKDERYLRLPDGRPLYFLGFINRSKVARLWGGYDGLRDQIGQFRAATRAHGQNNPYVVVAGTASEAMEWITLGADAVSAYEIASGHGANSFESLARSAEDGWRSLAATGLPVIPTVMAGWDRRPRIEHPMPWESQKPGVGMQDYFIAPTTNELARHIRSAIHFVASQAKPGRSPAVLIYAWNENDEGGWLVPTTPCNFEHLKAVREAIKAISTAEPGCSF